jgi:hypothetical protein
LETKTEENIMTLRGIMPWRTVLKKDLAHAMDTIRSRDQQISFYEAQIANLVQSLGQLAIKPGQEEAKKKAGGSSGNNRL